MANPADIRPDTSPGDGEAREGIALTSALALDRRAMLEALQLIADRATQQPRAVVETAGQLLRDLVGITFGSSEIEPAPKDARFKDDWWRDNPVFDFLKRTSIAYVTSRGYPELAKHARVLATYEGFEAHANAVSETRDKLLRR